MLSTNRVTNDDYLVEEVNGTHLCVAQVCVRLEPDTDGLTQISIYIFQRKVCHLKTITKNHKIIKQSHLDAGCVGVGTEHNMATDIHNSHKSKVIIT